MHSINTTTDYLHMPPTHAPIPTHSIALPTNSFNSFNHSCIFCIALPLSYSHMDILCAKIHAWASVYNIRTSTGEDMEKNGKARSNIALSIDINNDGGVRERVSNGKKRRPPAVLMEGSRCSRVNGRGWRCSQQTLIGYSLCEHHLGKGRIRSISSGGRVGGQEKRSSAKKLKRKELKARSMSSILDEHDDDDDSVDAMTTAKRGMGLL